MENYFQEKDLSKTFFIVLSLMPVLFALFCICYMCNEISVASSKLSPAIYNSDWIKKSRKYKKLLIVFMENTAKDMKLTAFEIFNLDLEIFVSILNTAYSLFAVLKTLNN